MDFWKAIFGLTRRKLIGPPLILLSLGTAALVFFLVPTYYVSTASMVLTTPATGGTLSSDPTRPIGLTNPLLQFSDGLRVTAGILILSLNTPEVAADLGVVKNGPTQITINDGRTNPDLLGISTNGPFIYVEVQSRSAVMAQDVVLKAKQRIRKELANRQQALKAPRSTFISVVDVVPSSTPEAKISTKLMAAGAALFSVLFIGLSIAYGVTQIREGRRRAAGDVPPPAPRDSEGFSRPDRGGEPVVEHPPKAVPTVPGTDETGEGPFHDDSVQFVVLMDDDEEEPLAHRKEQSKDTIVFMRAGGLDEHEK
ncbi:hypothetical protein [Streptosporangium sp. NPDC087985]|uniref:hypothetical protein n=1 Tax=Streptosporangium sp. NPDC087985 TaxID=3366196 RepID=UPI0037FD9252